MTDPLPARLPSTDYPVAAAGPLAGIRVVEMAGLGPAPFAAGLLAGMGAAVVRLASPRPPAPMVPARPADRRTLVIDLLTEPGRANALSEIGRADVLIEGFRPGVMERLGLSPGRCHELNPRLVYGRITGWGQQGPMAARAGHDINYLALSGGLSVIGPAGSRPVPPVNMVADFGGGSMFLIAGVLAGLVARGADGPGCVVDAAMVDGVGCLLDTVWTLRAAGQWSDARGENLLDGGAPFYDTYACADGRWVALGALEPRFYAILLDGLRDLADVDLWPAQYDRSRWAELRVALDGVFNSRERDFWAARFAETDACLTPVLTLDEAARHPHLQARHSHRADGTGAIFPAPAPRFSFG